MNIDLNEVNESFQGFTRQLQKEIDKNVSQEDVDLIFQVFDDFNKGYLKKSEFQIIMNEIRRWIFFSFDLYLKN